ncbi:deoxynucleoside triphosphate triphosphohydrolase SAMHD1-like isoform X2 [Halichondria panicea]|uniref:deoxynucleoside triphosphate triphosphohydrolase SAMHD1-like isoform X2 n=1 Tax=Halichondria panicea TaxID=6063 RepID=UPI00312B6F34
MAKRRRHGVVEAPTLEELISPVQQAKKRRLEEKSPGAWSVEEVTHYLSRAGLDESVAKAFRDHSISGRHLLGLTSVELQEMGIGALGQRKELLSLINSLSRISLSGHEKVFNDPIHGHIEIHPLMVKIIDTPQFQRLRNIKQLGGCYYVFQGASHNRFEHSIGVGYLAGELVSMLQSKQPELNISQQDLLCVKIAGLCHDLGHGPFSHMFDGSFIPQAIPGSHWKHEEASVMMFEYLLSSNNLHSEFEGYGLGERDVLFIKEQIAGPREGHSPIKDWPYSGRHEEKSFLYEIVANKRNGIDVDKWDYFARDCHCLGIPTNFDLRRFMAFARVIEVKHRKQICTRDKEVGNLYEMFHTRNSLHRRAYQHKTSNIIEYMLTEALLKADPHLYLRGVNGSVRMSEAIHDPVAYTRLTDSVTQRILESTEPALQESRDILAKIERRELYKCVGQTAPPSGVYLSKDTSSQLATDIIDSLMGVCPLTSADLVVDLVTFDYGKGDENPIDYMSFYSKHEPEHAIKVRKDQVSEMLPHKFREQIVRVYCKRLDKASLEAAQRYFLAWCRKLSCVTPELCIAGLS